MYIQFFIGDDCFEHVFLVSGQLIESLLIGADFLQGYGVVVNFKTSCLTYEIEKPERMQVYKQGRGREGATREYRSRSPRNS